MSRKEFLRALFDFDAMCAKRGVPALSVGWRSALIRWAERATRRLVIRAGRRSGKSLTLCKLAVAMALYAGVVVPVGDFAWGIFVSTTVSEALARLSTIGTLLDIVGVSYEKSGSEIRLSGVPLGFQVLACSLKTGVGRTAFFLAGDEMSRWESEGVNPARDVWSSLAPMGATIPQSLEVVTSAPLSTLDLHAEMCAEGDTAAQTVIEGPTWHFNPTVSEERCREIARTEREFLREFAALPQSAESAAFPAAQVEAVFVPRIDTCASAQNVLVIDPNSGGTTTKDEFVWGGASWRFDESGKYYYKPDGSKRCWAGTFEPVVVPDWKPKSAPYLSLHSVDSIPGGLGDSYSGDRIADKLATAARAIGAKVIHSDQRESLFLGSAMRKRGFTFVSHTWTSASKPRAVEMVQRWLSDGALHVTSTAPGVVERFKRQMLSFEEKFTPSGSLTFGGRGSTHDDFVALLVTLAHAEHDEEHCLSKSPYHPGYDFGAAEAHFWTNILPTL